MHSGRFQAIAQITTNIAHLGANRFRRLEFPLAPAPEQAALASRLREGMRRIDAIRDAQTSTSEELEKLARSLLAKAFRGELVT